MAVYNLAEDPFESSDVSQTARGKQQIESFFGLLNGLDVSCKCYQCLNTHSAPPGWLLGSLDGP